MSCGPNGQRADKLDMWRSLCWLCFAPLAMAAGSGAPTTAPAVATTHPTTLPSTRPVAAPAPGPDYAAIAAQTLAQTVRRGNEPQLASAASDALAALGAKAGPALATLQSDANPIVRARVMEIASAMNDPAAAVPLYVAAMKDSYAPIRDSALSHLRFANVTDSAAVCAAADALHDPDADVRQTAVEYLTNLGENAAPAVPKLAASLDSRGIRILANIGSRAEAAVPALLAFYQDASHAKPDRVDAVIAISRILGKPVATTQPVK